MPSGTVTNMGALMTTQEIADMVNDGKSRKEIIAYLQEEKNMTWGSAKNLYYNTLKEMVPDEAKHIVSLYDMCYADRETFDMTTWDEKITDSLNYLFLLKAIVEEGQNVG